MNLQQAVDYANQLNSQYLKGNSFQVGILNDDFAERGVGSPTALIRDASTGFSFKAPLTTLESISSGNPDNWLRKLMTIPGLARVENAAFAKADNYDPNTNYRDGQVTTINDLYGEAVQYQPNTNGNFISRTLGNPLGVAGIAASIAAPGLLSGFLGSTAGAAPAALQTGVSAGNAASGGFLSGISNSLSSALGNFATDAALSGAARGAIGGLTSGDGLGGVLKGAALGGVTGGAAPILSSNLGLGNIASSALEQGLMNATGGLANGDLQTAGLGAALGGVSGYLGAGGTIPGLGSTTTGISPEAAKLASGGSLFPDFDFQAASQAGSGLLGTLTSGLNNVSSITDVGGENGMNLQDILKGGIGLYSANQQEDLISQQRALIENAARSAEEAVQQQLSPYSSAGQNALGQLSSALSGGFNFEEDPGYQFRLQQGQQALERSLASQGLSQSGAALKAAQEYGQNLANQTYDDAYNRYLSQNSQLAGLANVGFNADQSLASALGNIPLGVADAQTSILNNLASNEASRNYSLAQILGGFF